MRVSAVVVVAVEDSTKDKIMVLPTAALQMEVHRMATLHHPSLEEASRPERPQSARTALRAVSPATVKLDAGTLIPSSRCRLGICKASSTSTRTSLRAELSIIQDSALNGRTITFRLRLLSIIKPRVDVVVDVGVDVVEVELRLGHLVEARLHRSRLKSLHQQED